MKTLNLAFLVMFCALALLGTAAGDYDKTLAAGATEK